MLVMTSVVTLPTGQLVTVGAQLVMVYTLVILVVDVAGCCSPGTLPAAGADEARGAVVEVTGQTVVYRGIVSVTTAPTPGQLVIVGAQLVMV